MEMEVYFWLYHIKIHTIIYSEYHNQCKNRTLLSPIKKLSTILWATYMIF